MKKKNVNTNLVLALIVLAGLLGYVLMAKAGNLEPSAAPAPTMKTLQEVYDAASSGINEREGFCQYFETPADSNQVVLTVPAEKRFVLLKLHQVTLGLSMSGQWRLTVNDNLWIDGKITHSKTETGNRTDISTHTFPDRCVMIDAGDTLKIENTITNIITSNTLCTTIIGYLYDVQ